MANYGFNGHSDKDLFKALELYGKLNDLVLMCVPDSFLIALIDELNRRGYDDITYVEYFGD